MGKPAENTIVLKYSFNVIWATAAEIFLTFESCSTPLKSPTVNALSTPYILFSSARLLKKEKKNAEKKDGIQWMENKLSHDALFDLKNFIIHKFYYLVRRIWRTLNPPLSYKAHIFVFIFSCYQRDIILNNFYWIKPS